MALWVCLVLCSSLPAQGDEQVSQTHGISVTPEDREPKDGKHKYSEDDLSRLKRAVDDDPRNRDKRFRLVRALMSNNKLDEALEAAKQWREVDAYNLVVVRLLGDIYSELGRRDEARRTYSAVVELVPKDAAAHRALASVLKQSGDLEGAHQRLKCAVEARPEDMRLVFELADITQRIDRLDEATELFEKIVSSDSVNEEIKYPARQRLAQIYSTRRNRALKGDDVEEAARYAELIDALHIKGGVDNDIKIYLSWDTDRSDVDLWVINPAEQKIFYSNKTGRYGGTLYHDVTTGYGPESFTAKAAKEGEYVVQVNYYGAGNSTFLEVRGEVIIVTNEGRIDEDRQVLPYRLYEEGQTVTVARIKVR